MKILFVNQLGNPAQVLGSVAVGQALSHGLSDEQDIELEQFQLPPWGRLAKAWAKPVKWRVGPSRGLEAQRWHISEAMSARARIREQVAVVQPDVLVVNSHTAALLLGKVFAEVPVVLFADASVAEWEKLKRKMSNEDGELGHSLWLSDRLERRATRRSSACVAFSHWTAKQFEPYVEGKSVRVIHPGLDLERFRPASKSSTSGDAGSRGRRVLFVGSRFEAKGGLDLLRALGPRLGSDVTVDVVTGSPGSRQEGVAWHTLSPGSDRLIRMFQSADLLALPTHGDAVPWVIVEALACGVPVVASAVGAIPEMLESVNSRGLVAPNDMRGLRRTLNEFLDDTGLGSKTGARGRMVAERDFDVKKQGPKLLKVFRECVLRK